MNIAGNEKNNHLTGSDSFDTLVGKSGNDVLSGLSGDDVLNGGEGWDQLIGGAGIDTATFSKASIGITVDLASGHGFAGEAKGDFYYSIENVIGSRFDDIIRDSAVANDIMAGQGNDIVKVSSDNDVSDTYDGGAGIDTLSYAEAKNYYYNRMGVAIDLTLQRVCFNYYFFDDSDDHFANFERFIGTSEDDQFFGDGNDNVFMGLGGSDRIVASQGYDEYSVTEYGSIEFTAFRGVAVDLASGKYHETGGSASGSLIGHFGVNGSPGADTIMGQDEYDVVSGGEGRDFIVGFGGRDYLYGDLGDDRINGMGDDDTLIGGTGDDRIIGDTGNDNLNGDDGNDWISAGSGNDRVDPGQGNDTMSMGAGNDTIALDWSYDKIGGIDVVSDFAVGSDKIQVYHYQADMSFEQLDIHDSADGAIIATAHGSITLLHVATSQLSAADFLFL